ncbi:Flp family type IVb pilin [bacterium]|nr:Flp family type IVb pilin [bacterium]
MLYLLTLWTRFRDEKGVTTVEWLGMAAVVVLVIAVLMPQVRATARELWDSIAGQLSGLG